MVRNHHLANRCGGLPAVSGRLFGLPRVSGPDALVVSASTLVEAVALSIRGTAHGRGAAWACPAYLPRRHNAAGRAGRRTDCSGKCDSPSAG